MDELFEEETCVQFVERSGSWPMKLLPERSKWVLQSLGGTMEFDHPSYYQRDPKKWFVCG